MSDVEYILNNDTFFAYTFDEVKEIIEHYRK